MSVSPCDHRYPCEQRYLSRCRLLSPPSLGRQGGGPGRGGRGRRTLRRSRKITRFLPAGGSVLELAAVPGGRCLCLRGLLLPPQSASIMFVVLESWQSAALRPETTLNLWEFAQESTHFRNHISSGSMTVAGLFGLMYGTHPTCRVPPDYKLPCRIIQDVECTMTRGHRWEIGGRWLFVG